MNLPTTLQKPSNTSLIHPLLGFTGCHALAAWSGLSTCESHEYGFLSRARLAVQRMPRQYTAKLGLFLRIVQSRLINGSVRCG